MAAILNKQSKEAVGFEHPAKGMDHCSQCKFFEVVSSEHCLKVRGTIMPQDWCKLFAPKKDR